MNNARLDHWRPIGICVGLFLITAFLYQPTSSYSWVNFDDNDYVTDNAYVASGLRWSNVAWAFTHFHAGYWIPVTWVSHMTDCRFWSLNPGPPHLVNAGLHSFNAVLLF